MKRFTTLTFYATVLLFAAVAFAQPTTTTFPAPPPVVNGGTSTAAQTFVCPPNTDKIWLVDNQMFQELCFVEGQQVLSRTLFQEQGGYQQIAVLDANSFFAYRTDGKVLKYTGDNHGDPSIYHWRLYGGGILAGVSNADSSVDLRLPSDGEQYRFYLYPGANPVPQQIFVGAMDQARLYCGQTVQTVTKKELCLNTQADAVWQPRPTIAGPDYSPGQMSILFDKQLPVNIAVLGEKFFVTLGTQYVYPDDPTPGPVPPSAVVPGKLVSVQENFDGTDTVVTLLDNVDINQDTFSQRLAVSNRGVYFLSSDHRGQDTVSRLSFYSFATKKVTPLYDSDNYISAVAVGQNAANVTVANPPTPHP